jgi:hypothetical protein
MPEGIESVNIIVDYEDLSMSTAPPMSVTRRFLTLLAEHYPERLHKIFFINPSW